MRISTARVTSSVVVRGRQWVISTFVPFFLITVGNGGFLIGGIFLLVRAGVFELVTVLIGLVVFVVIFALPGPSPCYDIIDGYWILIFQYMSANDTKHYIGVRV